MRSRANFRSHPLHPMVIPFPLAFLVGGCAFDVAGTVLGNQELHLVAYYLIAAGIILALVAAVPGFIDYFFTVPPNSSAKRRATKHMAVNLFATVLFAFTWWLRGGPGVEPDTVLVVLEVIAIGLLTIGGWMGGTLVYRNQIGIDHRYAHAGKWREARIEPSPEWVTVARADELKVDQLKLLHVGDERMVLARSASGYAVFHDRCTHKGGSLADGVVSCDTVTCPWHGSQFDIRSGKVQAGPAEESIRVFPVETRGEEIVAKLGG